MLKARCSCGATYQVSEDKAGKTFKCRKCGATVAIPLDVPPAKSSSGAEPAPSAGSEGSGPGRNDDFLSMLGGLESKASEGQLQEVDLKARKRAGKAAAAAGPASRPWSSKSGSGFGVQWLWRLLVHPAGLCLIMSGLIGLDASEVVNMRYGPTLEQAIEHASRFQGLSMFFGWVAIITGAGILLFSAMQGGELFDMNGSDRWTALAIMVLELLGIPLVLSLSATGRDIDSQAVMIRSTLMVVLGAFVIAIVAIARDSGIRGVLLCIFIPIYAPYWALSRRELSRHLVLAWLAAAALTGAARSRSEMAQASFPTIAAAKEELQRQNDLALAEEEARRLALIQPVPDPAPDPTKPDQTKPDPTKPEPVKPDPTPQPAPAVIKPIAPPSALTVPPPGLLDAVNEGAFEFHPPVGFVRHVIPQNRDIWKWEHTGAKTGENTMLFAVRRKAGGDTFDGMIRRAKVGLAITTPVGAFAWTQAVSESRSQRDQLQCLRLDPTVQQRPDRREVVHVLMEQDYVLYAVLSCDRKHPQFMSALESAAQTIRRRPPLPEKTPAPPLGQDQSPLSLLVEQLRGESPTVAKADESVVAKLPAATDLGRFKLRVPEGYAAVTPRDAPPGLKAFNKGGSDGATIWCIADLPRTGDHLEHRITRHAGQTRAFLGSRLRSWKDEDVKLSLATCGNATVIRIQAKPEGQTYRVWLLGLNGNTWLTVGVECSEAMAYQLPMLEAAAMSVEW